MNRHYANNDVKKLRHKMTWKCTLKCSRLQTVCNTESTSAKQVMTSSDCIKVNGQTTGLTSPPTQYRLYGRHTWHSGVTD